MLVLHAHWSPPGSPDELGEVVFWVETSLVDLPSKSQTRPTKRPKPKKHPFCLETARLQDLFQEAGTAGSLILLLPTTRSGPLPSPKLSHSWQLDLKSPVLAPWKVQGVRCAPEEAFPILLGLGVQNGYLAAAGSPYLLADDAVFWKRAAALVLETLAAQKLFPIATAAGTSLNELHARWLPILDSVRDAQRLAQLEAAIPPVCRAEWLENNDQVSPPSAKMLLGSFLNTFCDTMARKWGKGVPAPVNRIEDRIIQRWLKALLVQDPVVAGSLSQRTALVNSHKAWMRQLYSAGDAAFRIAFRLEAPSFDHETVKDEVHKTHTKTQSDWQLHFLLQARDDPSLLVPAEAAWESRGSILNLLNRRFEHPQEKMLAGLGYAARIFPPIQKSLKNKKPSTLAIDSQQAYTFMREAAPLLEGAGFGVLVPPWWNKAGSRLGVRLRLKPQVSSNSATSSGKLSLQNLVSYQWELTLGETMLSEQEFRALARLKVPLLQVRGQWVQLDSEQIEAAIQFWEDKQISGKMNLLEAAKYGLGAVNEKEALKIDDVIAEGWLSEWMHRLEQPDRLEELSQPDGLVGQLRPYQRYGYSWLHFHKRWGMGACLADDMGLGKTIQTIALLLKEKESEGSLPAPTLLICPTSVVTNWEREIARFAPVLVTHVHMGTRRLRSDDLMDAVKKVDLLLTSYPLVRQDSDTLQTIDWYGVILDEAQNIKNPSAQQTQVIRKIRADFRVALTGTPVENRLSELWSIMNFLNPDYLGSHQSFRRKFTLPIERDNDKEALQRLRQLTSPFILRRVKTDPNVIQDLPEKVETKVYCHLSEEQATLYEAVVQDAMKQIEEKEGIQRRGLVLSMLMQLKQICNHPSQYLHQEKQAVEMLAGRSGKLERLEALLEEVIASGDRTIIFTQFAEMGKLLASYLPNAVGAGTQLLFGGTPTKIRDQMVARFQNDDHAPPIFILSIKAGGTGLNLTRANHVFHFDRWWNPAVEDQATDRAFRIGQKRNVQVHKFVCVGTLEEMIDEMITSKKGLAESVIGRGENWLTELTTADLRNLVTLKRTN
jgi:SNF2 family DNA or RNA helicase